MSRAKKKSNIATVLTLALTFSLIFIDTSFAAWTNKSTVSGMQAKYWNGLDMSDDGSKMVAVASSQGGIWVSTDSGSTWVNRTPSGARAGTNWVSVTMSGDGSRIAVVDWQSDIWTSSDTGVTWTDRTPSGSAHNLPWQCIAGSSNGQILLAVTYTGAKWKSTDYGATWTSDGTNTFWQACAMNSTGQRQIAAVYLGYVYQSTDTGTTWSQVSGLTAEGWYGLSMSPDGTKIAIVTGATSIYYSSNSGSTWSLISTGINSGYTNYWRGVSISSDGRTILVAGQNSNANGLLWLSTDAGATWTNQVTSAPMTSENQFWTAKVSKNGQYLLAGGMPGTIGNLYLNATIMPASISSLTFGSGNPPLYRTISVLQANLGVAGSDGKVTFYANDKRIPGCINVLSASLVATCNWKPSLHGSINIKVVLTPTSGSYSATTKVFSLSVAARSNSR